MAEPILIVRPQPQRDAHGGDEVVYRRTMSHLRETLGLDFDIVELAPVSRARKLLNLATLPPEITRFASADNVDRVRRAWDGHRVVLFFNEVTFPSLPALAGRATRPFLVAHNVHSLVASSDPSPAVRASGVLARGFERRFYADPAVTLVCISQGDIDGLRAIGIERDNIVLAPPGTPPAPGLVADAAISDEFVMTGSYGWWRKRRDLKRLAAEASALGRPILANDAEALAALGAHGGPLPADIDWSAAIRFGIVSDRFLGGFKLKVLEYIANNCVVLSYADLSREFEGLPHAGRFVRHIGTLGDAVGIVEALRRDGPRAVAEFRAFKAACLDRYRWDHCLAPFSEAVRAAL